MRGRISLKSPIRNGVAYFSTSPFINQLGLNPVFTFLKSTTEKKAEQFIFLDKIVSKTDALKNLNYLDTATNSSPYYSFTDTIEHPNVILILMEGMSANYFKRYGNTNGLMAGLDSLMQHSINFDHFYSAGTHTFNGVYSSTLSKASLPGDHPMKVSTIPNIKNVIQQLNAANYKTFYFTTHDEQFDNIGGFLTHNGFSTIVSQKDYLSSEVKSNLGVPDHILFKYAKQKLNIAASNGKSFFATIMTASNHEPFIFPDDIQITYKTKSDQDRIKEYSDFAVIQFIKSISELDWGKRTIFVITGDHGKAIDHDFEISLAYHHLPLIIYSPAFQKVPVYLKNLGSQVDIMPTLLSMLPIQNKTTYLGKNIFEIKKEFVVSVADEKVLVLDSSNLLIFSKEMDAKYYDLKSKQAIPLDEKSMRMKIYAASYLQGSRND
jgi:phosphoglycerol transferase MdoB-like AlkP superfamily enzyme